MRNAGASAWAGQTPEFRINPMVIYLSGEIEETLSLDELTPRQIVAELDKHVVGQAAAKRAVAVALRNRIRRQKLPPDLAQDVMPKNIIMIGSTGIGKTEIARRLARLSASPFLKVEASKFTEVGYVGRDVESMIRDLVEIAVDTGPLPKRSKRSPRRLSRMSKSEFSICSCRRISRTSDRDRSDRGIRCSRA